MMLRDLPINSFFLMTVNEDGVTPFLNGSVFQKVANGLGQVWIQDHRGMDFIPVKPGAFCSVPDYIVIISVFPNFKASPEISHKIVKRVPQEEMI